MILADFQLLEGWVHFINNRIICPKQYLYLFIYFATFFLILGEKSHLESCLRISTGGGINRE